jgi:Ku70/Ku80 beta-barrel domain
MPRAIWSGSISFGLVNAPVKMYSAIDEHDLELHLVHEKDGSRIGYEKVCKKEGKEVPADEIVKAYDPGGGKLVYLTDEDFRAAEDESYRAIEILDFVPHDEIDPIVFQRSYFLAGGDADRALHVSLRPLQVRGRLPRAPARGGQTEAQGQGRPRPGRRGTVRAAGPVRSATCERGSRPRLVRRQQAQQLEGQASAAPGLASSLREPPLAFVESRSGRRYRCFAAARSVEPTA